MAKATVCILGFFYLLLGIACGGSAERVTLNSEDLEPGTTLHITSVHFQRHGPADDVLALSDSYQPETVYNETWIVFDDDGNAASERAEARGKDGKIWGSSRSDGNDFVYEDAHGEETHRLPGLDGVTVESLKTKMASAKSETLALLQQHRDAPVVTIHGKETRAIETQRRSTGPGHDVTPGNYVSVYTFDLEPVEEIRRSYISPEGVELRYEVVVTDAHGIETVVESSETTYEVLRG